MLDSDLSPIEDDSSGMGKESRPLLEEEPPELDQVLSAKAEVEAARPESWPAFQNALSKRIKKAVLLEIQGRLKSLPADDWQGNFQYLSDMETVFAKHMPPFLPFLAKDIWSNIIERAKSEVLDGYLDQTERLLGLKLKQKIGLLDDSPFRTALKRRAAVRREQIILDSIENKTVSWNKLLPREVNYGCAMDERVIELPLALEVADLSSPGKVLDAGSSLNLPFLRKSIGRPVSHLTHLTLTSDKEHIAVDSDRISYYFGDLRAMDFKDDTFDRIVCVSTLEHVGMDNERYGAASEHDPASYTQAFREMLRVLAPGGKIMVTLPYGEHRDLGWFQIFDKGDIQLLLDMSLGHDRTYKYYYYDGYWYEGDSKPEEPLLENVREHETITGLVVLLITKRGFSPLEAR